jgi:hypothetical protein
MSIDRIIVTDVRVSLISRYLHVTERRPGATYLHDGDVSV